MPMPETRLLIEVNGEEEAGDDDEFWVAVDASLERVPMLFSSEILFEAVT